MRLMVEKMANFGRPGNWKILKSAVVLGSAVNCCASGVAEQPRRVSIWE